MIGYASKQKRADTRTQTDNVRGLTNGLMHRIGLSVKMFRRIYQTALWCCCSCDGTERQGQSASGQLYDEDAYGMGRGVERK
jgi:hypothetical protein